MKDGVKYVVVGSLVGAFLLVVFVLWRYGAQGLAVMGQKLLQWLLILAVVALIVYLIFWLFQVKRLDLVAVHRDNIVEACRRNTVPYKQVLAFSSRGDNWAYRELGRIAGYCMIKAQPRRVISKEGVTRVIDHRYENLIFVAYRPPGLFNKIFGVYEVVAGVPEDFSTLSSDIVYLKGMTFAPKMFGLFFLSHHWEDRHLIDETVKENIFRYTLQETLKDLSTIVEDAIDASPAHKKKQEQQNIQTVPLGAYVPQPPPQK